MTPRKTSSTAIAAAVILTMGGFTATAGATQPTPAPVPELEWDTTLVKFQFDSDKFVGQRFSASCPPVTARDPKVTVYGTDVYPSNNAICVAALHAGKIDKTGGTVTVQLNPVRKAIRAARAMVSRRQICPRPIAASSLSTGPAPKPPIRRARTTSRV